MFNIHESVEKEIVRFYLQEIVNSSKHTTKQKEEKLLVLYMFKYLFDDYFDNKCTQRRVIYLLENHVYMDYFEYLNIGMFKALFLKLRKLDKRKKLCYNKSKKLNKTKCVSKKLTKLKKPYLKESRKKSKPLLS